MDLDICRICMTYNDKVSLFDKHNNVCISHIVMHCTGLEVGTSFFDSAGRQNDLYPISSRLETAMVYQQKYVDVVYIKLI